MTLRPGRLLPLILALGCATDTSKSPPPASPLVQGAAPVAVPAPAPAAAAHGIDVAGMDRSVAPGDDFFLHANGTWLKETEIPADASRWGTFNILAEQSTQRVRALLEAAAQGRRTGRLGGAEGRRLLRQLPRRGRRRVPGARAAPPAARRRREAPRPDRARPGRWARTSAPTSTR